MYLLNKKSLRVTLLFLVICLMVTELFGWCPIAHYLIARAAAHQKGIWNPDHRVEHYANLPDYEESKQMSYIDGVTLAIGQKVTKPFCWSHAVHDNGILNVGRIYVFLPPAPPIFVKLVAPTKPTYPDDGRYPGAVMKELLTRKLDLRNIAHNSDKHWILKNTVNGFRAHNAADRQVHFGFFEGATKDRSWADRKDAWIAHHGLKEVWADYSLLLLYGFSDGQLHFNDNGMIDTDSGEFILYKYNGVYSRINHLGFKGNAPLMHMAQLVYRKNRRALKADNECGKYEVQSVDEIKKKLNTNTSPEARHVVELFNQSSWAAWEYPWRANLIADFTYLDEHGNEVTIDPDQPANNQAEWNQLISYRDYTTQRFENADQNWKDAHRWTVWSSSQIIEKYNKSINAAKEWMYTNEELRLRHH